MKQFYEFQYNSCKPYVLKHYGHVFWTFKRLIFI